MIRMNLSLMTVALAGLFSAAHAIKVSGNAPLFTITGNVPAPIRATLETELNEAMGVSFNQTLDVLRNEVKNFNEQKDLARGFGNANAYSANSSTMMGYQNYDLFAVSTGFMLGFQAPKSDFSYYSKIMDDINEKGDLYAGLGLGVTFLNVGVNAGFIVPGLYLNAKYGGMSQEFGDDFAFDFLVWGVGANYRILDTKSLAGIVKWRGISVGTGFYHQSNSIETRIKGEPVTNSVDFRAQVLSGTDPSQQAAVGVGLDSLGFKAATPNLVMALESGFDMGLDISTTTIPIEASTAVSILFGVLNISAGLGTDLTFGSSEIILRGDTKNRTTTPDATKMTVSDADVVIDGSSDNSPSFMRTRLMAGAGLGLGPVKLDIPLYYYMASGAAIGFTVAVVW